jgi:hypothetical protein
MKSDFDIARKAARRAYEFGRLRWSTLHAGVVTAVAALAAATSGASPLAWLPLPFLVWTLIHWRGAALLHGARRGLVVGLVTLLLPLSILRPCCGANMATGGVDCCTMPSACGAVGLLLGASLALLLPRGSAARRAEAAMGMALGISSVVALRCSGLFIGEALGLLGGLLMGIAATSLARAWLDGRALRSR